MTPRLQSLSQGRPRRLTLVAKTSGGLIKNVSIALLFARIIDTLDGGANNGDKHQPICCFAHFLFGLNTSDHTVADAAVTMMVDSVAKPSHQTVYQGFPAFGIAHVVDIAALERRLLN